MLYPLKFNTIFKEKIWGGSKIKTVLNKDFGDLTNCGETWEISGAPENISEVANGELKGKSLTALIDEYGADLVGKSVYDRFGNEFPLLIKFIDANQDLSIQVHPNDTLAKERHNSCGKTEMWYVLNADNGSSLISGFNRELTKESYLENLNSGKLEEVLNREYAAEDDVFFLPAGRVHTIGAGLLLAEIQQTSDTTYRIYDFDRVDDQGNKRELHVEQALDAIDFTKHDEYKTLYDKDSLGVTPLVKSDYFETNRLVFRDNEQRDLRAIDSFVIYIILEGTGGISSDSGKLEFKRGDCILIPAQNEYVKFNAIEEMKALETFVP